MRVAVISYEYPPSELTGGIGTYTENLVKLLNQRGVDVEVFCGPGGTVAEGETMVHRVDADTPAAFREAYGVLLRQRHEVKPFSVAEAPEIHGEGLGLLESAPDIPLVVRFHTPGWLVGELNHVPQPLSRQLRFVVAGLIRGRRQFLQRDRQKVRKKEAIEEYVARRAALCVSPTRSLAEILISRWRLERSRIRISANVFEAPPGLAGLSPASGTPLITYLGRLEVRKGIVELAEALPRVFRALPGIHVQFIGESLASPCPGVTMKKWLIKKLKPWARQLIFAGKIDRDQLPGYFERSSLTVLPSRWENFPNTCLEAMAAGQPVIGSVHGGMAEILEDHKTGILVDPSNPVELSEAVIRCIRDSEGSRVLGKRARESLETLCNKEYLFSEYMDNYRTAIGFSCEQPV